MCDRAHAAMPTTLDNRTLCCKDESVTSTRVIWEGNGLTTVPILFLNLWTLCTVDLSRTDMHKLHYSPQNLSKQMVSRRTSCSLTKLCGKDVSFPLIILFVITTSMLMFSTHICPHGAKLEPTLYASIPTKRGKILVRCFGHHYLSHEEAAVSCMWAFVSVIQLIQHTST